MDNEFNLSDAPQLVPRLHLVQDFGSPVRNPGNTGLGRFQNPCRFCSRVAAHFVMIMVYDMQVIVHDAMARRFMGLMMRNNRRLLKLFYRVF